MTTQKVGIFIGQLGMGGGERQLYLLLSKIDTKRFVPIVITFNPDRKDFWEEKIVQRGIKVIGIPRSSNKFNRVIRLYRILKSEKFDTIISWTLHLNLLVSLLGWFSGVKIRICSVRNDLFNRIVLDRPIQRFTGVKVASLFATHFIANSSKGRSDLVKRLGVRPNKVSVIFNAVVLDIDSFSHKMAAVREQFGWSSESVLIVNIGRLDTCKNQKMLIEVMSVLAPKAPKVHAVFIGEGDLGEEYVDLAKELHIEDRVHFIGKLPKAVNYLQAFDIMCHTSFSEGMPNVLLEGAINKLPIVSTRVNGAEDIVLDGSSGFIVDHNQNEDLAQKLLCLYESEQLRSIMGQKARERVRAVEFSQEHMVSSFEKILGNSYE